MVTVEKNSEAVAEPTAQKTPDKVPASSEINLWHDTKNGVQRSVLTHTSTQLVNTELLLQVTL